MYALAGILFFRIIKDRPFIEGNKRTAVVATEMFLEQNGAQLTLSNDRLYVLAVKVAKGELTEEEVAEELRSSPPRKGLTPGLRS
ncbi:type II toxin-antitoxin system death-on-curing family toxin [Hydrogenivirga sp. 128-5-R1-1]|uniref:type II toxin-antitoxin system death-on-curing family toxin n=1 Tax=Hydrogenivirga sp. 128-5-R1-1 TaxID=392423 RepID=UPI0031B58270